MAGEEKSFRLLKHRILSDTSVDCGLYKENYLRRRLAVRMRGAGVRSHGAYLEYLRSKPGEYDGLLRDMTVNLTSFFRDPDTFKIIEEEILPLIIHDKVRDRRKRIRLWSAGCSSGEEVYTLAIIIRELLGEDFHRFMVHIHGTDIDDVSLTAAKLGRYPPGQLENVPPELIERHFTFDGETYHVSDELRDMAHFKKSNLFNGDAGSHFDLIVCRNVLIYFTKEMQRELFSRFRAALNRGAYLVLGRTESVTGDAGEAFVAVHARERIYQKT